MKKLYKLILLSYSGTFIITLFIAIFVFLMIFVFAYIDEFVGKNFGMGTLMQLFFYFSLNTIPRALPLAFLLSSIMVIGNMAEHLEIAAMKSSGISFSKITRPLFVFTITAGIFLFLFSNFILPANNLKLQTLLMSIRSTKPALMFKPGVFNNELKGFSMRMGKIGKDGKTIEDVLMYDHTSPNGNTTVLYADSGRISELNKEGLLFFTLYRGSGYKEMTDSNGVMENNDFIRDNFEEKTFRFDLSEFMMKNVNEDNFKKDYDVLSLWGINSFIDSLRVEDAKMEKSIEALNKKNVTKKDTASAEYTRENKANGIFYVKHFKDQREYYQHKLDVNEDIILKYTVEWHKRVAASFACLILFFIGAPLGYIIKKGGLGMPLVVSTLLYIAYHTLSITGEKLAEDGSIEPYQGIWLASAVLFPIGLFLFNRASKDAIAFDGSFFYAVKMFFKRKK